MTVESPDTRTLELPGTRLHYEVAGSGAAIVLVHGLALDLCMWDDQVPALSGSCTVVRYDARGFGRSERDETTPYTHADDLWQLVDHLGLDRVTLVGLSMGGRIVLEAALAAPDRVTSLVLLDAVLDGVPWDPDAARGMELVGEAARTRGLEAAKAAWLRHPFFGPAQRRPDVVARLRRMVADYPGQQWTGRDPHAPQPRLQPRLTSLDTPTTVVVGELDVPCFRQMADVLADRLPRARKIVVPDAGHMVNMEAPDVVNTILREAVLAGEV